MRNQEILTMGRKAETIYTTQKKNQAKDRKAAFRHHNNNAFEKLIKKFFSSDMKRCYVYINGISMPISHA